MSDFPRMNDSRGSTMRYAGYWPTSTTIVREDRGDIEFNTGWLRRNLQRAPWLVDGQLDVLDADADADLAVLQAGRQPRRRRSSSCWSSVVGVERPASTAQEDPNARRPRSATADVRLNAIHEHQWPPPMLSEAAAAGEEPFVELVDVDSDYPPTDPATVDEAEAQAVFDGGCTIGASSSAGRQRRRRRMPPRPTADAGFLNSTANGESAITRR